MSEDAHDETYLAQTRKIIAELQSKRDSNFDFEAAQSERFTVASEREPVLILTEGDTDRLHSLGVRI